MKAFWWLKPNSIAGMARPGFNYIHWMEMPFDEAVLFGWLGLHSSGDVNLGEFRAHLKSYAPRIFKFHRHDDVSGPKALEIFASDEGMSEVLERLKQRTRAIDSFKVSGDEMSLKLSDKRLRDEIDFLKQNGVTTVVTLTEKHHSRDELAKHFDVHHFSIKDLGAPQLEQAEALAEVLKEARSRKDVVVVHCLAGIGRTSTMLASAHVLLGETPDTMEALLRKQNPAFALTKEQSDFIKSLISRAKI